MRHLGRCLGVCVLLPAAIASSAGALRAADCNENGIDDALDIAAGRTSSPVLRDYPVGLEPYGVIAAELTGDDRLEIATINVRTEGVSLLVQKADGTYEAAVSHPVGEGPHALLASDLDDDGDLDLAAGAGGSTAVLIHRGAGFADPVHYLGAGYSTTLLARDMDGDRSLDLIRPSDFVDSLILVLFNGGDGTFEDSVGIAPPAGVRIRDALVVALDGGDAPDVVFSGALGGLFVARNAGSRVFSPAVNLLPGKRVWDLAAADLDGDRSPELITLEAELSQIAIGWNDGGGNFAARTEIPTFPPVAAHGPSLFIADFDGDESPDIAALDPRSAAVWLLLSRESRAFELRGAFPVGDRPWSLTAADVNLDGTRDIITANTAFPDAVSVLLSPARAPRPAIHFAARRGEQPGHRFSVASVLAADVDRDGVPELVTAGNDVPAVIVIRPGLTGALDRPDLRFSLDLNGNDIPDECEAGSFVRGDSNADGRIDVSDSVHTLSYLFLGGPAPPCLDAADIDDSGDLDISDGHGINVFLFLGGSFPSLPGPFHCGIDPTADALDCLGEAPGCR